MSDRVWCPARVGYGGGAGRLLQSAQTRVWRRLAAQLVMQPQVLVR